MGFCALIERLLGRHAEARALVLHELAGLSDSEAAATAMLKLELATGRLMRGDRTADRSWAREAMAIARRLDVSRHAASSPGPARCSTPAALDCSKPGRCGRNDASTPVHHVSPSVRGTSMASPGARRRSRAWCRTE